MDDGTNKNGEGNEEGWVDLDQYQREQSIEGPEQAQEETAAEDGDEVEDEGEGGIEAVEAFQEPATKKQKMGDYGTTKAPVDKAARKREKKERQKAEKKARQQSKQTAVAV